MACAASIRNRSNCRPRIALGEQPDVALIAVTHTLAVQTFYGYSEANVLDIRPSSAVLASHADGIEDTAAGKALADRAAVRLAQTRLPG
jgi:ParB family chromosome partitioning protein